MHDAINYGGSPLPSDKIYERDTQMIKDSDIMVAEVTNPSLGVGYELAYAEKLGRPILCLFNTTSKNKLSAMVSGNSYNTVSYTSPDEITAKVKEFIDAQAEPSKSLS